jgi:hypothetical protein
MGRIVDFAVRRLDPEGAALAAALGVRLGDAEWPEIAWLAGEGRRICLETTAAGGGEYAVELLGRWEGPPHESLARTVVRVHPCGASKRQWVDHFAEIKRGPDGHPQEPRRSLRPHVEAWLEAEGLTVTADKSEDPAGFERD